MGENLTGPRERAREKVTKQTLYADIHSIITEKKHYTAEEKKKKHILCTHVYVYADQIHTQHTKPMCISKEVITKRWNVPHI